MKMERDMFNTMTMVKVLSGLLGTWLALLLGSWAAELIYHGGGGHGDHDYAYVIHAPEDDGAVEVIEEGPPFEELLAMADLDEGATLFQRQCSSCHANEAGDNGAGPYLHGVVGRDVASADGFGYSGNLIAVVDVWTAEELNGFIEDPGSYAPGTVMGYGGMDDVADRANLIAYLDALDE